MGRINDAPQSCHFSHDSDKDPRSPGVALLQAQMLRSVPVPKWVFTNADVKHAERCLDRMGIRDCFQVRATARARPACHCMQAAGPCHAVMLTTALGVTYFMWLTLLNVQ